ncbi:MAG: DEAD/DEAH box helicase family protein [Streptococcus salivarius]
MQEAALEGLRNIREQGKGQALVISATGTGKTFLSAFDVKNIILNACYSSSIVNRFSKIFNFQKFWL